MTIAVGITALALGNPKLGWLLILLSLIGGMVGACFIFLGRQSMARAIALSPRAPLMRSGTKAAGGVPLKEGTADVTPMRWTGKARVPSPLGYVFFDSPLAVLERRQGEFLFRVRPRIAGILFGIENLTIAAGSGAQFISFRGKRRGPGIEIRVPQRASCYFWPKRPDEVIAAAAALGLEVVTQEML